MKKKKLYLLVFLAFIIGVGYSAFHKWSVDHVLYMTGGVEHPIGCVSCHVYPERDGLLANMLNEDYLSPLKQMRVKKKIQKARRQAAVL